MRIGSSIPTTWSPKGPAALPVSTLRFLYPSRYCQSDLVSQQAWDTFGQMPRGYGQVRAVRDWVNQNCRFQVGTSNSATSAIETLRDGVGVCRDFAHTMITYCRALNYPARFVTGIDYGADPALGPQDFHAYVEVFIGGTWFMFDPTGISPITGPRAHCDGARCGGSFVCDDLWPGGDRDASVVVDAIDDPARGFVTPVATDQAVSTAD